MWRIWIAGILGVIGSIAPAGADTVYLRDGQALWGSTIVEEDGMVVVERAGGDLRIPKRDVSRIEGAKMSIPPFYAPPGTEYPSAPAQAVPPAAKEASAPAAQEAVPENAPAPPPPAPVAPPPPRPTLSGPFSPRY